MTLFNIIILVLTVIQIATCHFSFFIFIGCIGRVLYSLRAIGIILKVKTSIVLEGIAFASLFLWQSLFHKGNMNIKVLLISLVIGLLIAGVEFLDDILFIYTTEDDIDVTEVSYNVQVRKHNKNRKHKSDRRSRGKTRKSGKRPRR